MHPHFCSFSLRVAGRSGLDSEYTFVYRRHIEKAKAAPGQRLLNERRRGLGLRQLTARFAGAA
jgi:hypothetical protein